MSISHWGVFPIVTSKDGWQLTSCIPDDYIQYEGFLFALPIIVKFKNE